MTNSFPKNFLFGAATSAHQVEGNNNNDWAAAEASGRVPVSGLACDSYHRYEEDFDLAVALGHNSHRLSLEWSRIEPREGQFDLAEVAHYRQVLQALRDRGLKSFVTLWHFTLPNYLVIPANAGTQKPDERTAWVLGSRRDASPEDDKAYCGWEDPRVVKRFEEYAQFCATNFGDLVDFWITENEPTQVYGLAGYLTGNWPPFKKRALWSYLKVCWNLGQAHNHAYDAIKKVLPQAQVGLVENFSWTSPKPVILSEATRPPRREAGDPGTPIDRFLATVINFINQRASLVLVKGKLDFLGVNHYFHNHVHWSWRHGLTMDEGRGGLWASDLGWTLEPRVIYNVLKNVGAGFSRPQKIPIYITENGLADEKDASRQEFTAETLGWVKKAMEEGVDVRGYLHWTLLDNYEWLEGYTAKFGLIAVDFDHDQTRTIRPSALWFRDFLRSQK